MTPKQLAQLRRLATLARDAARLRLGALCQRRAAIGAETAALLRRSAERRRVTTAVDLCCDAAWRRILLAQVADLESEIGAIEPEIDAERRELLRLDGRVSALEELIDRLGAEARRRAEHRAENDRPAVAGHRQGNRGAAIEPAGPDWSEEPDLFSSDGSAVCWRR